MAQKSKKFNFTEANIAALPFAEKGKRYRVQDASTKNLAMRVGEKSKTYYLVKNINGRVLFVRLGDASTMSLKKAKERLTENMGVVDDGKNPNDEKRKIRQDSTLRDFYKKEYFPKHCELSNKPRTRQKNENLFRIQLAPLHNKKMLHINRADIENLHKSLGKKSIYAANRMLALIKHMYSRANAWGLSTDNPARGIKMFRETSRRRFLLPDEIPRLFAALETETNPTFRNYILLSLYCGQRRENMLAMRWDDVNLTHNVIYIADTKNNEPQIVPLPEQAVALLHEMKKTAKSEWLFPSSRKTKLHLSDPRLPWRELLKRADIKDFRLHDLRRTYGSYKAQQGANETIIQKALGDKSRAAASVYMRLGLDPVRASVQRAIDEITTLAKPAKGTDNE
ncbi:MAG: site-specific integrase [Proteobacteria bacterium]|nr:site-specific integrase [Pseudomonadota bacterium]